MKCQYQTTIIDSINRKEYANLPLKIQCLIVVKNFIDFPRIIYKRFISLELQKLLLLSIIPIRPLIPYCGCECIKLNLNFNSSIVTVNFREFFFNDNSSECIRLVIPFYGLEEKKATNNGRIRDK